MRGLVHRMPQPVLLLRKRQHRRSEQPGQALVLLRRHLLLRLFRL
jgi:hypothetical protein